MKIHLYTATTDTNDKGIRAEMQFEADENVMGGPLNYELDFMPFMDYMKGDFEEFESHFKSLAQYNGIMFESCNCAEEYSTWQYGS